MFVCCTELGGIRIGWFVPDKVFGQGAEVGEQQTEGAVSTEAWWCETANGAFENASNLNEVQGPWWGQKEEEL